jgi:hypothetical protein
MDILVGVAAVVVMISVPTVLALIYLELRQRRMFGHHDIITKVQPQGDFAAIAMTVQSELERLRAEIRGSLTAVSTDIEQVRESLANPPRTEQAPAAPIATELHRLEPERASALAELYGALSALEIAFLAVSRPMLLPGEPFDPEIDLPSEAFTWESWNDVGTAAYGFAEVFSKRRIALDQATRERLNTAITAIRRNLTTRLFPALTDVDGGVPASRRDEVATLVNTLGAEISDVRAVLEHASVSVPTSNNH